MYSTQIIADRISEEVKRQNKNKTAMLKELKYGVNTISEMRKGKQISAVRLAGIADYLGCSVDYLLGRDVPNTLVMTNVHDNSFGFAAQSNAPVSMGDSLSTQERDLLQIFRSADGRKQVEIMQYMYGVENG